MQPFIPLRRTYFPGIIWILFLCLLRTGSSSGQQLFSSLPFESVPAPYESDILAARPVRYFIAIGGGVIPFQHLGDFSPNCECRFSGGKGLRPLFAAEFSVQYPKLGFSIKAQFTYQNVSADFVRRSSRTSVVVGDNPDINVEYENTSQVKLHYLAMSATYAWYFPYTQIFMYGGFELGYPVTYTYNNEEKILTPGVRYYDGNTTNTLLPTQNIPGGKIIRLGIAVGIGIDIILSSRFYLTPEVGATYPFSTVTSNDTDWKVMTERALLFLKFRL